MGQTFFKEPPKVVESERLTGQAISIDVAVRRNPTSLTSVGWIAINLSDFQMARIPRQICAPNRRRRVLCPPLAEWHAHRSAWDVLPRFACSRERRETVWIFGGSRTPR